MPPKSTALGSNAMYRAIALFLVAAVLWICGSLPWVIINTLLCDRNFTAACPDPEAVRTAVRQILALDLILIIMSAFAIVQLRQSPFRLRASARRSRRPKR